MKIKEIFDSQDILLMITAGEAGIAELLFIKTTGLLIPYIFLVLAAVTLGIYIIRDLTDNPKK